MTAASNSDARKRNAAQVDPVEVVEVAIRFSNGHLRVMNSRLEAEAMLAAIVMTTDHFAHLVVRDVSPWRSA